MAVMGDGESESRGIRSYRDLVAWQVAMELIPKVYRLCEGFPYHERFGLTSQLQRAAVSVAANIAEGQARFFPRPFAYHLRVANGSLAEVDTLLNVAVRLDYVAEATIEQLAPYVTRLRRLLCGLIKKLETA